MESAEATENTGKVAVPIIDISSWIAKETQGNASTHRISEEQIGVAKLWDEAFIEFGCVILVGHGISEDHFTQLNEEMRSFFAMPITEKLKYNHGEYGHPLGGYTAPGNEIVSMSCEKDSSAGNESKKDDITAKENAKFDPVENFVFTSQPGDFTAPTGLPCPFALVDNYYQQMEKVLDVIHCISSAALKLPDIDYFHKFYYTKSTDPEFTATEGTRSCNALRLAHYPALDASILRESKQVKSSGSRSTFIDSNNDFDDNVRYGAHTDYQGYTILRPDKSDWHQMILSAPTTVATAAAAVEEKHSIASVAVQCGGLEVYHRKSQQWLQVRIPSDLNALVVNAADLIQRWTNDRWHSPLHRVVTAKEMQQQFSSPSSLPLPSIPGITHDNEIRETARSSGGSQLPAASATATIVAPGSTATTTTTTTTTTKTAGNLSRQSIVFFSSPLEDCIIESLDTSLPLSSNAVPYESTSTNDSTSIPTQSDPSTTTASNAAATSNNTHGFAGSKSGYAPIRSGDHLFMKLNRTNGMLK